MCAALRQTVACLRRRILCHSAAVAPVHCRTAMYTGSGGHTWELIAVKPARVMPLRSLVGHIHIPPCLPSTHTPQATGRPCPDHSWRCLIPRAEKAPHGPSGDTSPVLAVTVWVRCYYQVLAVVIVLSLPSHPASQTVVFALHVPARPTHPVHASAGSASGLACGRGMARPPWWVGHAEMGGGTGPP